MILRWFQLPLLLMVCYFIIMGNAIYCSEDSVLLVKVGWKHGLSLGSEEGSVLGIRLLAVCSRAKKWSICGE